MTSSRVTTEPRIGLVIRAPRGAFARRLRRSTPGTGRRALARRRALPAFVRAFATKDSRPTGLLRGSAPARVPGKLETARVRARVLPHAGKAFQATRARSALPASSETAIPGEGRGRWHHSSRRGCALDSPRETAP